MKAALRGSLFSTGDDANLLKNHRLASSFPGVVHFYVGAIKKRLCDAAAFC